MVKTLVANNMDPGVSNLTRVHSVCFQDQISATDVKWSEKRFKGRLSDSPLNNLSRNFKWEQSD